MSKMIRHAVAKDELGTHLLGIRDFSIICKGCGKERHMYDYDIDKDNNIAPKPCSRCCGENIFSYWLDGIYSAKEYDELVKKAKERSEGNGEN